MHINRRNQLLNHKIKRKVLYKYIMKERKHAKLLEFPQLGDERGHLVVVEGERDIPFTIQRAFYIYGSDRTVTRGQHANRKTEFVLINVSGTSKVKVMDADGNESIFNLDRPHIGVYIPNGLWKDMYDFSEDSVLLVLASEHYDGEEYIRDFNRYISEYQEIEK